MKVETDWQWASALENRHMENSSSRFVKLNETNKKIYGSCVFGCK
jgi:hypothetical protein